MEPISELMDDDAVLNMDLEAKIPYLICCKENIIYLRMMIKIGVLT